MAQQDDHSTNYLGLGELYNDQGSITPTLKAEVHAFCIALQTGNPINSVAYANRLMQATKNTSKVAAISKYFTDVNDVGQKDSTFDGVDCSSAMDDLAVSSTAFAISSIDAYGFKNGISQDGARDKFKSCIARVMPAVYGDHVNQLLKAAGQDDIKTRMDDAHADFRNAFQAQLLKPTYVHLVKIYDDAHNGGNYALNLLFANAYLQHGPGFTMSNDADLIEELTHWTQVLNTWIKQMHDPQFKSMRPQATPHTIVPPISCVCALGGFPDAKAIELVNEVRGKLHPELDEWNLGQDVQYYKTLGQKIMDSWTSKSSSFMQAANAAVNDCYTTDETHKIPKTLTSYKTTTYHYGDNAQKFIDDNKSYDFLSQQKSDSRTKSTKEVVTSSICFRPGTQILTPSGSVNIEDLHEGIEVVTRVGEPAQIGICSDENVATPTEATSSNLMGINNEPAFFTPGHVFHTTTGLRAFAPHDAEAENPWLRVGKLDVGHVLLRTSDGKTYEHVPITSFSTMKADCKYVYGVHLREGLRSYHANGYLVHLNYPEITLKSISKALLMFSSKQRLEMLGAVQNLNPLFARFGISSISEMLDRELHDLSKSPASPTMLPSNTHKRGVLEHLTRAWDLKDIRTERLDSVDGDLPTLDVYEGVLYVASQYCANASISNDKIVWSRQLENSNWEHGFVRFDQQALLGHGAITVGDEHSAPDVRNIENIRRFSASARARRAPKDLLKDQEPHDKSNTASGLCLVSRVASTALSAFNTTDTENVQPHGHDAILRDTPGSGSNGQMIQPEFTLMDSYNLGYDTSPWDDSQSSAKTPAPYLQVCTANETNSQHFTCRIPTLDKLRDAICSKLQSDHSVTLETMPELYECYNLLNDDQTSSFYFTISHPSIIASAADDYDDQKPRYSGLTFKDLGLDLELPFIFSSMRLTLDSFDGSSMTGIIREFDPTMLDDDGKRHFISGDAVNQGFAASQVRAFVASRTVANRPGATIAQRLTAHNPPKRPALTLVAAAANSVPSNPHDGAKELCTLPLDNSTLSNDAQALLYLMAKYQMTDDERKTFTDGVKPQEGMDKGQLPPELASNLPGDLTNWLKDKYIPGFIASRIVALDSSVKSQWSVNFNAQQEARVGQWWRGKGKGCLSQAPEYTRLNELASTYALLQQFPRIQDYLNDGEKDANGKTGGEKWASAVFNSQGKSYALSTLANTTVVKGTTRLQVVCNVLNTLSPVCAKAASKASTALKEGKATTTPNNLLPLDGKPYSMQIIEAIKAYKCSGFKARYIGLQSDPDSELEYQFLNDAVQGLWTQLLSKDEKSLGGKMALQLQADTEQLVHEMGIDANLSAADKAATMAGMASNLMRAIAKASKTIGSAVKGIAKAVKSTKEAVEEATGPESKLSKAAGKLMAPCMAILTAAMFAYQAVGAYRDWSNMNEADRSVLVLSTIQTTIQTLEDVAVKPLMEWLKGDANDANLPSIAQRDAAAAAIEENTQTRLPEISENSRNQGIVEDLDPSAEVLPGGVQDDEALGNEISQSMPGAAEASVEDAAESAIGAGAEAAAAETSNLGKYFALSAKAIKGALAVVGVAVTIASAISLAEDYGNMDTVERRLNIANVVVMGLGAVAPVLAPVLTAGIDAAVSLASGAGLIAAETASAVLGAVATGMAAIAAFAGPLLVVAGIVLTFLMMFHVHQPPPPLSAPEQWIKDKGNDFANALTDPPTSQLTWSTNTVQNEAKLQTLTIVGKNSSSKDVVLADLQIKFPSGGTLGMLFSEMEFTQAPANSTPSAGQVSLTNTISAQAPELLLFTTAIVAGTTPNTAAITWLCKIEGPRSPNKDSKESEQPRQFIVFKPGEQIQLAIAGTVQASEKDKNGPSISIHESWVDEKNIAWDQWEEVQKLWTAAG